ncbi:MAG: 4-hydroxy-tetrahydrodipicolinate reductase, partial [Methanomicrobiales archaeon]|nr:4-hydroxy-tetrahydrodipicolinate reductase [Methanomicrobiales archaeon]
MIKVAVCGALGRMGTIIGNVVSESKTCTIVGGVDLREGLYHGKKVVTAKDMDRFLKETRPDVMVDFTVASAAVENIRTAANNGVALVVGTTGFTTSQREEIRKAIEGRVPA